MIINIIKDYFFNYLFSRKDLRLNPYIIEQNLAPILNPSFKETIYIYIEKNTNLRICYARELLLLKIQSCL